MSQEDGGSTATGDQESPAGQEPTTSTATGGAGATQEAKTFDEAYVKQLREEAAANRTARKDLEARLKEIEDRDKTDSQKLSDRAASAETRAEQLEAKLIRLEVAAAKKLPPELADRLSGSNREELLKDADKLLKLVGEQAPAGGFDGGARGRAAKTSDMDSLIRAAAGL